MLGIPRLSVDIDVSYVGALGRDDLRDQLHPMLSERESLPELDALVRGAEAFVRNRVLPRTDSEREYLSRFARGDYAPSLIFEDEGMARAAETSPQALWKLRNLVQMHGNDELMTTGEPKAVL